MKLHSQRRTGLALVFRGAIAVSSTGKSGAYIFPDLTKTLWMPKQVRLGEDEEGGRLGRCVPHIEGRRAYVPKARLPSCTCPPHGTQFNLTTAFFPITLKIHAGLVNRPSIDICIRADSSLKRQRQCLASGPATNLQPRATTYFCDKGGYRNDGVPAETNDEKQ